jgi:3-phenylpropionate/trans-cinnamate dioxygenase ferredoxin subunit
MTVNYVEFDPAKLDFVIVAEAEEIPNGERLFLEIDDLNIVIFNIAGKFFAIGDVCSHDDGPVGDGEFEEDAEYDISCPRHGGRFDVRNGKATVTPAVIDIPAYPVRENEGNLEVGLPIPE